MYRTFLNLEVEKQHKIINSALKEFSINNYDTASTNKIIKDAKISKGILYHYFGSKKNLYLYLYEYVTTIFIDAINSRLDLEEPDIFKRYEQIMKIKLELIKQYHTLFDFLKKTYIETSLEVRSELDQYNLTLQNSSYESVFAGIDYDLFHKNIDSKKAIDTIRWVTDGISDRYEEQLKSNVDNSEAFNQLLEQCMEEANDYFQFLKQLVYKNTKR